MDILLEGMEEASVLLVLRVFRVFRVSRLLRLLGPSSTFRSLLKVLVYSLPSIYNIGALLFMLYFVYAILGINMFSETNFDEETGHYTGDPQGIGEVSVSVNNSRIIPFLNNTYLQDANFRSFNRGFVTLFRASTGENWQQLLEDCAMDNTFNSEVLAGIYFYSFIVFCQYISINLFIAVLLENFNIVQVIRAKRASLEEDEHTSHY